MKGVTYGTFKARPDGARYPSVDQVDSDFASIAALGLNTVRVYTIPPIEVVDLAGEHGLRLLVGLDYDDWRMVDGTGRRATESVVAAGLEAVDRAMAVCGGRPEVLAVSVGNEVPADLVRVHGVARVERALERLLDAVHDADPGMLATYTNYPSTEYLDPEGQDLVSWNVFLEDRAAFARYLRHILALAGERPLLLSEFGLSAGIHGEQAQAESVQWQIEELVHHGAAGGTVFSWTDEWAVADAPVDHWQFGVTRVDRTLKPAAHGVAGWPQSPAPIDPPPRVSVVICAYNESVHIEPCIRSVLASAYPDVEVIVCDDGSSDDTADKASRYPVKLLRLGRGGLSAARNEGMRAATGDIVAYLDADAEADPRWIPQLVRAFDSPAVVAAGGPNHPFEPIGLVEAAVAASPGNPREVLVSDTRAEHIAGCNMAFRRKDLLKANGFDVAYRTAGDDVDLCWRLLDAGHEIAFAPTATIEHHRRGTVRGYLRQQRGYGRAERMLQGPHRHRFNRLGQARWRGVVYGGLSLPRRLLGAVVYHGSLGLEPFQPKTRHRGESAYALLLALLPALVVLLAVAVLTGAFISSAPLAIGTGSALLALIGGTAAIAYVKCDVPPWVSEKVRFRSLVAFFHVAQPLVRFWGRLTTRPLPSTKPPVQMWRGDRLDFIDSVARRAQELGWKVAYGGPSDAHDLVAVRGFTSLRGHFAVVWNWTPRWRVRVRPRLVAMALLSVPLALGAVTSPAAALTLAGIAALVVAADLWWARRRFQALIAEAVKGSEVHVIDLTQLENKPEIQTPVAVER
ncbi:MAG: glycosyltransferase [Acidimicrobiales bacterium]|nr:glycosyltransferase [Acidimicrobiales bacterium]